IIKLNHIDNIPVASCGPQYLVPYYFPGVCRENAGLDSILVPSQQQIKRKCIKSLYVGNDFIGDVPLTKKILAALTTAALAITVANPTDLVKVRLQAEGKLPPGAPRRYSGALNAHSTILRQEGVGDLWTGIGPNIARNAIINAAELASYDQVKQTLLKIPGFKDNVVTHLFAGLGAGFFAVCIGSPVDVVKSRMMGDSSAYKNRIDCFVKTLKNDGPLAFYKGFIPNFGRLGSWNVIQSCF
ncbi:mitochondrial uncoupling protein 1-like, partial [Rosa sericea]